MKALRIAAMLMLAMFIFTTTAFAATFVPSIEAIDSPEHIDDPDSTEDDDLIVTPIDHLDDEDKEVHDEIEDALIDAKEDLEKALEDLIENFEEIWDEITDGAPIENAVITEIFDVRHLHEIGIEGEGKEISFDIRAIGLEYGDAFIIIAKSSDGDGWKIVNYTIDENGIITIEGTSKTVYAIIRDSAEMPQDGPDGPATGVSEYLTPAIIGAVVFGLGAVFCLVKIGKRNAA
ncbi:MAG: hypothetical protein IJY93_04745 [Clostridia bacterium]|nr:hypothetical protein [Clostridia bacterium]